jgi:hypothetical protein
MCKLNYQTPGELNIGTEIAKHLKMASAHAPCANMAYINALRMRKRSKLLPFLIPCANLIISYIFT